MNRVWDGITCMSGPTSSGFILVIDRCRGRHVQCLYRYYMHVGAGIFRVLYRYYMYVGACIFRVCVCIKCMSGADIFRVCTCITLKQGFYRYCMHVGSSAFLELLHACRGRHLQCLYRYCMRFGPTL